MLRSGLQAAAQRLPFPADALGWAVRYLTSGTANEDGRSPLPTTEELRARRHAGTALDAAFFHLNLGDRHGNAATPVSIAFDDLFLMAADRYLSVGRWCPPGPGESRSPQALLVNRMMVDRVVEAPGGAHFTTAARLRRGSFSGAMHRPRPESRPGGSSSRPTCPAPRPTTRRRCAGSQSSREAK